MAMKSKYLFHPREFLLGRTEKFYTDQAAKGWILEARGGCLSRFVKSEPKQMRYRVEVISPKAFTEWEIPDEQVTVYEDCGWTYVTGKGYIHVFCAPENSDAQEFYLDPAQQADTLKKLRRSYRSGIMVIPLYLIFYTAFFLLVSGNGPEKWLAQFYGYLVTQTEMMLAILLLFTWSIVDSLWATFHLNRICRKMKKGIPLDHSPGEKGLFPRAVKMLLLTAAAVFALLWITSGRSYPMPMAADGPYLTLSDLGVEGERVPNMFNNADSSVRHQRSLLCESWDCAEFVADAWLYHEVYRMKAPALRDEFVRSLMCNSVFADSAADYRAVEIDGLDGAWIGPRLECIGVKGEYIGKMTGLFDMESSDMQEGLTALAEKWKALAGTEEK